MQGSQDTQQSVFTREGVEACYSNQSYIQIANQNMVSYTLTMYTVNIKGKPDSCPD